MSNTTSTSINAMNWTELRAECKALGLPCKTKAQAIDNLTQYQLKASAPAPTPVASAPIIKDGVDVSNFDYKRYLGFTLMAKLYNFAPTPRQYALIKALECHYKVDFSAKHSSKRGELSERIESCLKAIASGKVVKRTPAEVNALIQKHFKAN